MQGCLAGLHAASRCLAWLHDAPARHAAHVVPAPRLRGCTPRCLTGCAAHSALRLAAAQAARKHTPTPRKTRGTRANRTGEWRGKRVWVPSTLYGAGNHRSGNGKSLYEHTAISHSVPMRSHAFPVDPIRTKVPMKPAIRHESVPRRTKP